MFSHYQHRAAYRLISAKKEERIKMKKEQQLKNRQIVSISMTTALFNQVNELAAIAGDSRSRWIVDAIKDKIKKNEKETQ